MRYKDLPVHQVPNFSAPFFFQNRIFLRARQYRDYISGDPEPETIAVLEHEYTHFKRNGSNIRIWIKYWTNREFRFQEELAAIRQQMKILKQNKREFDTGKRARALSGIGYLWCTNYETAKKRLDKMWEEV
jgi:predicted  nucleic acid-binding Zn-ribbon protein